MAREMKDSGIEWIGEIPREWKTVKFKYTHIGSNVGEAIDKIFWSTDENDRLFYTAQIQPIRTSYKDFPKEKYTTQNDILLARNATPYVYLPFSGAVYTDHIIRTTIRKEFDKKFVRYCLQNSIKSIIVEGVSIPTWSISIWNNQTIPCPVQSKQQAIADFLDTQCAHIDSVIEKTRAAIEEYKRLKQSIITQAVTKGIRPNRKMKDSGIKWIREIPVDWKAILITRILDYSHPYPLGDGDHGLIKTESYQQTGVPYIRVQNLSWGTDLILNNLVYISEEDNNRIINSTLKPNDILFAKTGATIGKTGIVPDSIPIANTTSHIGKLTVSDTVNSKYVFYCLSSHVGYRQFWERACLKATRPELTIDEIRSIKVILPDSFSEQSEIVNYLDEKTAAIDSLIQKKEQLISELEAYKKSLIYEYVTGKKEVLV